MTIKELAEELQVSKVTVSKTIERLGLKDRLQKEGNRFVVPDSVADQVRLSFNADVPEAEAKTETPAGDPESELVKVLKAQVAEQSELIRSLQEEKRELIKKHEEEIKLHREENKELIKIVQQNNHLLLAEKVPPVEQPIEAEIVPEEQPIEVESTAEPQDQEEQPVKKGLWSWFFGA